MRQHPTHEWLDADEGSPLEVANSLEDLAWIHRHLGGESSWRQLITAVTLTASLPRPLTLLDIGAGTGQVTRALAAAFALRGYPTQAWALDRRTSHLRPDVCPALAADATRLPFADRSWDLVTCNLFLHHFHDHPALPEATRLLAEMARVARVAVLINDLERAWIPYLVIHLLAPRFSRLTRHDGPRSVRQAYTAAELDALASGSAHEVVHLPRYRLGLILWCRGRV